MLLNLSRINRKKLLFFGLPALTLIAIIVWAFCLLNQKAIYNGVSVNSINISGLTREQAENELNTKAKEFLINEKISVNYEDKHWKINLHDISFKYLTAQTVNQAYTIGRQGNVFRRLWSILSLRFKPVDIKLSISYDKSSLMNILSSIKKQIDKNSKNAEVIYNKGNIILNKEEIGQTLEIDKNLYLIDNVLKDGKFKADLVVSGIKPDITLDKIAEIKDVLASFFTTFNTGVLNRSYNINLACKKINGTIIFPNEIFSMHRTLGPRTLENGYKEAPVIYKDELVQGAGGGVCQVTTTLYNAVLLSKLLVIERTHHSMPLTYVNPGQDATIAEDYIDFKFQNSRGYPVCISSEVIGNKLDIRILGKKDSDQYNIRLKSEVVDEIIPEGEELIIDNNIADNEKVEAREAKNGLRAVLYRETYDNSGNLIDREKISDDIYKPIKAQFKVNQNTYDQLKGSTANK